MIQIFSGNFSILGKEKKYLQKEIVFFKGVGGGQHIPIFCWVFHPHGRKNLKRYVCSHNTQAESIKNPNFVESKCSYLTV